ncbi:hypothetical protein DW624_RS00640 [Enterococcus hirae]
MPNWAEGTMKIRGTKENIINCLNEYLLGMTRLVPVKNEKGHLDIKSERSVVKSEQDDYEYTISCEGGFYIKDTQRAFIEGPKIELWFDNGIENLEITDFKQAWSVSPEEFVEMSEKHQVDIKIFVFERGMEFTQEIEIIKGKITKDISKEYDDYFWDVPFASIGG